VLERGFAPAVTRPLGVRAIDTGDAWTLTPREEGGPPQLERGKADGEAVLSGTASDLLLSLWKRLPADRLAVDGDQQVAAAFLAERVTS
jgi:hypothetical protein